jgi:hypothetical protein
VFSSIWDFLKDPANQAVLGWIGGGIAAVAAGIFAVFKFRANKGDHEPPKPSVSADHGSVAAGRDISGAINMNARGSSEPAAQSGERKPPKPRGGSKR